MRRESFMERKIMLSRTAAAVHDGDGHFIFSRLEVLNRECRNIRDTALHMEQFIGCDAHKRFSVFVAVNERGQAGEALRVMHADPPGLRNSYRSYGPLDRV